MLEYTVVVKSFSHLNQNFFATFLEERDLQSWPLPPGGSQKIHEINVRNFLPALQYTYICYIIVYKGTTGTGVYNLLFSKHSVTLLFRPPSGYLNQKIMVSDNKLCQAKTCGSVNLKKYSLRTCHNLDQTVNNMYVAKFPFLYHAFEYMHLRKIMK